jgi:hypothetical protein
MGTRLESTTAYVTVSAPEAGRRPNRAIETLVRSAEAAGKRLIVSLADA